MLHWLDAVTSAFAPRWTLKRQRARLAADLLTRHYDAAGSGRRTQGWRRSGGDANAASRSGLERLREQARDLIRNNPYAESALATITDHAVGWGIVATPKKGTARPAPINMAAARWKAWAETTACDADRRLDFAGLQKQVMRTVVEAGEVLVRRRWRRLEDGLPIPMQLQVLEPDFLDLTKEGATGGGGRIIQGVEFDGIGRRVAYWLFTEHPGATLTGSAFGASQRVAASDILHIFKPGRPGQARGVSWFAPVLLRMKDFDDYEDAALMKQKIAACLAVVTTDIDGTSPALGTKSAEDPTIDMLEPGIIANLAPGRQVTVVDPPTVNEHAEYSQTVLRAIATGLGVTYEDLTGDYTELPFSAARMSRLRHWARVEDWRWRMLVPQFCDPVWRWAMEAAVIVGLPETPAAEWTAPPMPLLDPDKEGLALQRLIRIGAMTWPEMVRERGYDPEAVLKEIAEWNAKLDAAKVVLDCDPRRTSQQGQPAQVKEADSPSSSSTNRNGVHV